MKLGDRIKKYEKTFTHSALKRMPLIIRVDGRAFHTFTKGLENMVKLMKHYGWKEIIRHSGEGRNPEQILALRRRCVDLAREIPNGEKRLAGLAEKICGTSQLNWCRDTKKLERLLAALGKIKEKED